MSKTITAIAIPMIVPVDPPTNVIDIILSSPLSYLDYELRLEKFDMKESASGTPEQFRATVAVDDKLVDIEVNSPYSHHYGEDIYLVSYGREGCVLQIVREPWRALTALGVGLLLLGAFMLFMQGFQTRVR